MLLERAKELASMADLLATVGSSGGKVVLVRGEAGIGKSALVREFLAGPAHEAHVLFGSCDDLLTPQPLGPVWDISQDEVALSQPLQDGDRRAVMGALLDLLARKVRPTVMVIEDTHWADEATLDVIKFLGRRIARTKGILLLTYRDGEVDYDHSLRQVIGELPPENIVRIHLDNLSPQAISDLMGQADLHVEEMLTLTGGNPLFVTEVLVSGGMAFGVQDVPASVQDSVLARASKLSPEARNLLDLVSVVPGGVERTFIDRFLELTQEHIAECKRQGLLRTDDDLVFFHHELTRRSVESALNSENRRKFNEIVLAELGEEAELSRLVHHASEAADVDALIEFAPRAARAAMAIESHREAAAHFRLMEPYLDQVSEARRVAIVEDWARTEYYLIGSESIDLLTDAIELYRSSGNDLGLARALTFAVRVNEISGRPEEAEAASREAISILEPYPPSADLAAAVSQRAWLLKMRGRDWEHAVELADRAIELAELTGDELSQINALNTKGILTYRWSDPSGLRLLEDARSRAEKAGYPFEETLALLNMAEVAAEHREVERASDISQRARDTASRYEIRIHENAASAHYAKVLDWKGQWTKAEDIATEALGHVLFYSQLVAGQVLGPLQARQGRANARATIESTWSRSEAGNEMQSLLPSAAAVAEYMWLTGETDQVLTSRFRDLLSDPRRYGFPWPAGWLAFWLGTLGELIETPDEIAEPYRLMLGGRPLEAAAIWEEKNIPYEQALALMLDDVEARLKALGILESLGATAVAAKLRKALRDEGVVVSRGQGQDTKRHAAGLTARQAEVLQLLDERLTNTEIADRLFVSPRTVENHVAAILTKLDCSTRDEAVARARELAFIA